MTVANLVLRVAICLAIVAVAIGMTAAASETVGQCAAPGECAPNAPNSNVRPAGPGDIVVSAQDTAATPSAMAQTATVLVVLVTILVVGSIFVILLSYRLRPGGVRAPHR
jgi:hypothetical protein